MKGRSFASPVRTRLALAPYSLLGHLQATVHVGWYKKGGLNQNVRYSQTVSKW